ncbi:HAMP domain-containing sensor histidine kinase [Magnetovibrio sp. PR-2]|uniref:sensor histidine kinase n=1 Tax=Magnetovibrio sp. PR-2 TaxID=3120356 RepID=UPI002FCDEC36
MSTKPKSDKELLREFAHEIRNPLNALMGYSHMIQGEDGVTPSKGDINDYAGRINSATKRLLEVCERVLDESIQGRSIVNKQDVDFHEFCPEIVRTFEAEADEKGVKLSYEIDENFPLMHTDPVVLYEIMSNLIGNAIKFTPKGGLVRVKGEVSQKNEALILVVQDTGKGIPSTILRSIMKGDGPTTTFAHSNRRGWGQGMQTILEKAELLGGTLQIESALSGGTVAAVRLPVEDSVKTA